MSTKATSRHNQKNIVFSDAMLAELEEIAKAESRNFTDLVRECCRRYIKRFKIKERMETENQERDSEDEDEE